ncbi:MAG: oligosaccharide flippase family protein [Clostridia bacterium]|nr:oligosaccharide flippase family protein [Clostridia bacterium]
MKKFKLDQLKMGAALSYFTMAFNTVAGLIYTPWMVAKIGQADYGLYTLANSLIAIFMLDFGLGSAVSRYIAKYRAEGRNEAISNIMGVIYKLYIIIDIVILAILTGIYFFLGKIYVELTPAELEKFRILYVTVATYQIIAFPLSPLDGILNAYEKFTQLKICSLMYRVLSVVAVVFVLVFSSDVRVVILATVSAHLITILIKFLLTRKYVGLKVNFRAGGRELYINLFSFTAWTTLISIMQRFTHSFAPSVLGITSGALEIGLYSPAVLLEGYFYSFGMAVNGLFLPRVSRYIANKEEDNILKLMIKVGRYQSMVLGLVFIGFVCVGKEFMALWMGPDYTKSYYLAIIILFPTLISATQQIAKTTVIAKKLVKYQALCMSVTGVLGLATSYFLSIKIGAAGVCIGTAATSLANITFMNFIYKKKAGINVFEFYKKCYFRLISCYAVILLLSFTATKFISLSGWIGLGIKAVVVGIIFVLTMLVGYTTKEEKNLLLKFVKKHYR